MLSSLFSPSLVGSCIESLYTGDCGASGDSGTMILVVFVVVFRICASCLVLMEGLDFSLFGTKFSGVLRDRFCR